MKNNENADRPMSVIVYVASSPFRLSGKAPAGRSQSIQKLVQNQHTSLNHVSSRWESTIQRNLDCCRSSQRLDG